MGTFLFSELFLSELLILMLSSGQVFGASFYGDGYVQLKTVEASSRNSLYVRFRTSSHSGLLFLAAGERDFLLVELHSGRLQIRLELGSGERPLRSEKGIDLNDLMWHSIELQHYQHNITLTVDHSSHTSLRMPGPEFELSVQHGLFVGGAAGLEKPYLQSDNPAAGFRGCLDEVIFNQHNLLSSLRPYSGYKSVHEVSLGCSPQFSASEEDPISFFSSRAYVSLPLWDIPQEGAFECELHTAAEEGLLLFSSAHQGDFIAMEIREGRLVTVVGNDGIETELGSLMFVNDQKWHQVKLHLLSQSLQLTVGEETVNSSLGPLFGALQLRGPLYIGGVDDRTRSEVRKAGLLSVNGEDLGGGSFKGCLRDIRVNTLRTGLPHALVTKDISVGCEPEKVPEPETFMTPTAIPSVTPPLINHNGLDRKKGQNFLLLRDLVVAESGRAPLEPKHFKMNLEFRKLGIRLSQIMFRIEEQPVHGQLRLDVDSNKEENTFSILDLWQGKVMYVHGGSEDLQDFFMFSVFTSNKKEIPTYLKGNRLHRFNISVTPVNDAPELSLPEGNLFILLENSERQLNTDVLRATDTDSKSTDLVFTVLGNLDTGFLVNKDHPDTAITTFFQTDLEEGKVSYVHTGMRNSRVALRVSDGDKVSNVVVLRIMAVQLEHRIANNTGVEVNQGGEALISTHHLAVQVNVVKQAVDIRYEVEEPPRYGELQRLHSNGEWKPTRFFSQKFLEKERIRYLNTFQGIQMSNITDLFKCKIIIGSSVTDELVFHIKVRWIHFKITRSKMEAGNERRVAISSEDLRVISKVVKLPESDLHFRLLSLPKKGHLVFNGLQVLKKNSTFSQKNISDHLVKYELISRAREEMRDTFSFQVFSKHAHSGSHDFRIHIKPNPHLMILVNKGLAIMEGESKVITKDQLFTETVAKVVYYTITSSPKHGKLQRINFSNSASLNDNIMAFTNQDILEKCIMYVHDDSETTEDAFTFQATIAKAPNHANEKDTNALEGTFKISIKLVNDEKPVRVVDKVFHVARERQRLLTLEDLRYHDADSDFDDRQLLYTRRVIPMGDLVLVNNTSHKLFQFHQKDLEERRVLFLHKGVSFGRFVLFVTDGKHYSSSLLEVKAEDPYIHVGNNTGLVVQKGHTSILGSANFSVLTNLDIREEDEVVYKVFLPPRHGDLLLNDVRMDSFTQHDLSMGRVVYHHDDSRNLVDSFNFTVKVKEVRLDASVGVRVYLESHQRPPKVVNNYLLLVEEGKPIKINRGDLEVTHVDSLPSEIVFTVTEAPSNGFLWRSAEGEDHYQGTEEEPVHTFSQEDVNTGCIQYVQLASDQTNDSFLLDATNGLTRAHDIKVLVDIIPLLLPLRISNLTLDEGSSKALTKEVITVTNSHFSELNFLYSVTEPPRFGHIEHSLIPGVNIPSFTHKQVEQEYIHYVHDGSDTVVDNFTLIANNTDIRKHSLPCTVFINVTPVNDEPPVIVANRMLRVWVGSVTEITVDDLSAEDSDSQPESLEFIVTPPSNGHLALKSAPSRHILNFTLAHILQGQLMFVHSGALSGGFHFQVNDGVNFAPREIFSNMARSLVLSLERLHALKVFPGSLTTISQKDLLVVTNNNGDMRGNHSIIFSVTSHPKLGRLVRKQADYSTLEISSFTQNMVNEGLICYEQTHPESMEWVATDFFIFTVSSPPAFLQPHMFSIHISYDNPGPAHNSILIANTGAIVMEGGTVVIDKSKLDASNLLGKVDEHKRHAYEIWYHVTTLPMHGLINVGKHNLTSDKANFSQFILDKFGITYMHDDSETTWDVFTFEAWPNPHAQPAQRPLEDSQVVTETFNITVTPVNDQPPLLKTGAPGLRVVQGTTVMLGPENLQVDDLDTPPEEIHYRVISTPSNGYLTLRENLNQSVSAFSQADVNQGRVYFVQDGEPSTGVFYFSVTDGYHQLYKLFNLEVAMVSLSMVNNTGLTLVQGQTTVTLSTEHLAAETNGRNTSILYIVTAQPGHGRLFMDDQSISVFHQDDLQSGRVSYHMTDLRSSWDSFEFTVATSECNLTSQTVNITVRPLIHLGEYVLIASSIAVKLRKDTVDVTELAMLSGSDPVFHILSPPQHGKVVKVSFDQDGASHSVESFTFRDVEDGRVAIETLISNLTFNHNNRTLVHPLNDSFVFLLKADNVPPARGEFLFTIVPYDGMHGPGHGPGLSHAHGYGPGHSHDGNAEGFNHTTRSLEHNGTIGGRSGTQRQAPKQKTTKKIKSRQRGGNNTRAGSLIPTVPRTTRITPVPPVESLPRQASDPLLIILPFLACLLLIVILIVLTLVSRHRKRQALIQELSAAVEAPESSPYLGRPERSIAMPSVVVTPLIPSCPSSPVLNEMHTMVPPDAHLLILNPIEPDTAQHCRTPSPTLSNNQYWV